MINDKDTYLSDNDSTDSSYSIASVLPSNKRKKVVSPSNDLKNSSLHFLNQQQTFSTSEISKTADTISDHRNKSEHSQQKIYPNESNDLSYTNSNQQQQSHLNLSEGKNLSTHSSKLNHDKLHQHEIREYNDRLSTTSVSDLFTNVKKQKSLDLDSINTAHSIPISVHPSVLPEVVTNKDDKNHTQSSRTTLTEKCLPIPSNIETKQLKNIINTDTVDQNRPIDRNLPTKRTQSYLTDTQENQPSIIGMNNTFNQVRSTYDDM